MFVVLSVWSSGADGRWADGSWRSTTFDLVEAANTWVWVLGLIGAAGRYLRFENRLLRYANQAAYPVYLLHQTVIVAVAYFVVRWRFGPLTKWCVVLAGSLAISLAIYDLVVRRTKATRAMFGMKEKPPAAR